MRILFISSGNMMATHLAYIMKNEGHDVKLFIDDPDRNINFKNLVEKTSNWKEELKWVGKGDNGLIVFDDIGYGKEQDKLRKQGYSVFGGSVAADKLESDRPFAQRIFSKYGIKTVPIKNFRDITSAINFIKNSGGSWVVKQNGGSSKGLNYVGQLDNGSDVVNVLMNYRKNYSHQKEVITLQEKINGVEIGVARYFNGNDWVGPIEYNVEHKKFFPDDMGPATSEMGTIMWYDIDEECVLYKKTLHKLRPYLKKINFKGDIDINLIVNEKGIYPLEATPRLGSPAIYLQAELTKSPWGEFLKAVADGKKYDHSWIKGYGIVVLMATPPFPYAKKIKEISPFGMNIYFDSSLKRSDFNHIHFEGVAVKNNKGADQYYISDHQGYILYVTAVGKTIKIARTKVGKLIKHIYFPKMFYRNDIGINFIKNAHDLLRGWGYM